MTEESFNEAAWAIAAANNLPFEKASHYLSCIGDTPELAEDGRVIVCDESGIELARIILPIDES